MKIAASSILLLFIFNFVYGQKDIIDAKLKLYNIPGDYITDALKDSEADYYFKFRSVTWKPSSQGMVELIEEGEFNPASPVGERWKLLKINERSPDKKEIKKFSKVQNTMKDNINAEIDNQTYKIVDDNEKDLVISISYKKETLPKRYEFLSKCSGLAYIDKHRKRLTRIEYRNENPVKVWSYRATGLSFVQYFTFNEDENDYLIDREEMDIEVDDLVTGKSILFDIDYSDYKKVK